MCTGITASESWPCGTAICAAVHRQTNESASKTIRLIVSISPRAIPCYETPV